MPKSTKNLYSVRKSLISGLCSGLDLIGQMFEYTITSGRSHRYIEKRFTDAEWRAIQNNRKRKRVMRDLKKKEWVTCKKVGDEMIVRLDSHLLVSYLKEQVIETKEELPFEQMCLVAFDFPNVASKARDHFRFFIKKSGFKQVQLSLWCTSKNVADYLVAIVQLLSIEKWVKVYIVKEWT